MRAAPVTSAAFASFALAAAFSILFAASAARAECVETGPAGGERPTLVDTFPDRGTSGYAATLHVVVSHGKGETVLPRGLELQSESDAARALKSAGFALPDQDGGGAARLSSADVDAKSGRRQTTLDLPLVALPSEPGRHTLTLPPLPVADRARQQRRRHALHEGAHDRRRGPDRVDARRAAPAQPAAARAARGVGRARARPRLAASLGARRRGRSSRGWSSAGCSRRSPCRRRLRRASPGRSPSSASTRRATPGLLEMQRFADFFDRVNDAVREYLGRALRLRRARVDDRRDARGAAARCRTSGCPLPEVAALPPAVRPREVRRRDADARGVRARARSRPSASCARPCRRARCAGLRRPRRAEAPPVTAARTRWYRGALVGAVDARGARARARLAGARARRGVAGRDAGPSWPGPLGAHPSTADTLAWLARAGVVRRARRRARSRSRTSSGG